MMQNHVFFLVLFSLLASHFSLAAAARLSSPLPARDISPQVANSSAVIVSGSHGYTYAGCYNETTGIASGGNVRALANGNMTSTSTATPDTCIAYCAASDMQYAGLEYGQECWCAPYLSALSAKLDDSSCDLACVGNTSEICGGSLRLTLYNRTRSSSGAVAAASRSSWMIWAGAVVFGVVVQVFL